MAAKTGEINFVWRPQKGPQLEAIQADWCEEIFFGGARGGGKSDFLLGDYAKDIENYAENWKGILFRKTYKELEEIVARSKQIYPKLGGVYKKGEKTWYFPNGATLKLRHLENDEDAELYQGHSYAWIGFDELPNWASDAAYLKLRACLRNGSMMIPVKRIRSTGNPGGAGHAWVKERFIMPSPNGFMPIDEIFYVNNATGTISPEPANDYVKQVSTRMFIPSRIQDNQILLTNDPLYISRLAQTGSVALVKAWLLGDWDAIEGAFFDKFNKDIHVVEPFKIPDGWYKFRAFDWGYARPFSVGWYAVSDGREFNGKFYPAGALIKYREWYGGTYGKNEGLRMENDEIARQILKLEKGERIDDAVADPSIFTKDGGDSIADQMFEEKCEFRRADNERVAGWQQIRYRLANDEGQAMLYFFKTCTATIGTIATSQHDKRIAEDLDTDAEDHAADETRYACMSRPLTVKIKHEARREDNKIYVADQIEILKRRIKEHGQQQLY